MLHFVQNFLQIFVKSVDIRIVKVEKKENVEFPRSFSDYTVTIDKAGLPANVTVEELI